MQASPEQVSCEVAPDVVVLNYRNGEYYGLNAIGARFWALLQATRTVLEIGDQIRELYPDVTAEQRTLDLLSLLDDLAASELIHVGVSTEA